MKGGQNVWKAMATISNKMFLTFSLKFSVLFKKKRSFHSCIAYIDKVQVSNVNCNVIIFKRFVKLLITLSKLEQETKKSLKKYIILYFQKIFTISKIGLYFLLYEK